MISEHLGNAIALFNEAHDDLVVRLGKDDRLILEAENGDTFDLDPQILFFWYDDLAEVENYRKTIKGLTEKIALMRTKLAVIEKKVDELIKNWT